MTTPSRLLTLATTLATLLMLASSGCNDTQDTASVTISDVDLTAQVKTVLRHDDAVKHFDIDVYTEKGIVRLTGIVDNQNQIDRAFTVTRAIAGVQSIHDELKLKP
jgi:hyperosmotically inducible protein